MLEIRNLSKKFGDFAALNDLSMTVPRGAVYGLVGPNGAGKTTLIRHITGVLQPDGGTITVTLSQTATQAVFSVKDTGMGISEEDLTHIFDRFYRVDKARSRESGGTGLGLSIVRQLVTLHGGQITVDSTPGHGSTFTVTLPIPQKAGDDA